MIYSHPKIPLKDHLREVGEVSENIVESKELNLTVLNKSQLKQLAYLIGIAHDFGKATTFFQLLLEGKKINKDTHHAPISSLFAYILGGQLDSENNFLPILAYLTVRYHHSNLFSPDRDFYLNVSVQKQYEKIKEKQYREVEKIYNELLPDTIRFSSVFEKLGKLIKGKIITGEFHKNIYNTYLKSIYSLSEEQQIELFLCCNFLFSVLIDSDKKSAGNLDTNYFDGATDPVINVESYIEYLQSDNPEKFDPNTPINQLRNLLFEQATRNTKLDKNQYLYTLTAPTGIGKTFTAFGVANKLKEKIRRPARIIYALPFTSIIDQNHDELKKILEWDLQDDFSKNPTKYLLKHHYLSPMEIKKDKADEEKEKIRDYAQYYDDRILNESWDAGHIVTTFVQLLESVIGYKNRQLKKFHNITNSILILDEVQNIPADFHLLIGKLLQVLAYRFNTYIVLMTATQPTIFKNEDSEELADPGKLFNEEKLNRVEVNCFNELKAVEIEYLTKHVFKNFDNNSILIVGNTKSSANKIYEQLKTKFKGNKDICFYCLTTFLTPTDRLNQINEIQEKLSAEKTVVCISTQLIEAGVDLSFPVVYRDIGPFDSIIQVAGRCNRNGELKSKGKLYLLKLKGEKRAPSKVYNQLLLQYTNKIIEGKKEFTSNEFFPLGEKYFDQFDMEGVSRAFLKGIKKLNYSECKKNEEKPVNEFKLIKEKSDQVELIVCTHPEIEKLVYQLEENRKCFKDVEPYSKERKSLVGEALELRQKLANYTITLYENQLDPYADAADVDERFDGKLLFIPYKYYEKGKIYDKKRGFILNPESTTQFWTD